MHGIAVSISMVCLEKGKTASLIVIQWESQGVAEVVVQCLRLSEGGEAGKIRHRGWNRNRTAHGSLGVPKS